MRYLLPPSQKTLAEFVNGTLWAEIKLCLDERKGEIPDVKDPSHVAAAKGHRRAGAEAIIQAIESLPFEKDESPVSAFERPAVSITED